MDAMKYSMEADKYRAAYMPPSTLAMSMYSDPKYLDSSPKPYLDRGYLDSAMTKAYFESSKMYMDQKNAGDYGSNRSSHSYEPNKLYEESSPGGPGRSPTESPDMSKQAERTEQGSSSASSTSTSSAASPGGLNYYPGSGQPGLLPPQMGQYPGYQTSPATAGNEFRRPLTVIF